MIGPVYEQTVIKTEKAVAALRFTGASQVSSGEIAEYRKIVRNEEIAFQEAFIDQITDAQKEILEIS